MPNASPQLERMKRTEEACQKTCQPNYANLGRDRVAVGWQQSSHGRPAPPPAGEHQGEHQGEHHGEHGRAHKVCSVIQPNLIIPRNTVAVADGGAAGRVAMSPSLPPSVSLSPRGEVGGWAADNRPRAGKTEGGAGKGRADIPPLSA